MGARPGGDAQVLGEHLRRGVGVGLPNIGKQDALPGPDPAGDCLPDPLGGPCHEVPFVTLRFEMPLRLPWGSWPVTLPGRAVAEAGESPQ